MAITKIQAGALPAGVVTVDAIADTSITHAKLHTTMDLSGKTVTLPTISALDVTGAVTSNGLFVGNDNNYIYQAATGQLNLRVGGTGPYAILGKDDGSNVLGMGNASGALAIYAANAERLRITSAGNVGIGTALPVYPLVVSNSGAQGLEFIVGGTNFIQSYNRSTSDYTPLKIHAETISFGTDNGSERMRINSTGDVMVKTADARIGSDVGSVEYGTSAANSVRFYTANAERLRMTSTGDVGIGTSSPSATLHVSGQTRLEASGEAGPHTYRDGNAGNDIRFFSTNGTFASPTAKTHNSSVGQLHYSGHDGTTYRQNASIVVSVDGTVSTGTVPMRMTFHAGTTTNTERMRIDSSGRILIGTTTASGGITVNKSNSYGNSSTTVWINIAYVGSGQVFNATVSTGENGFTQLWTISGNPYRGVCYFAMLGGDSGHAHSKDTTFRVNGNYIQQRNVNYTTGRVIHVLGVYHV